MKITLIKRQIIFFSVFFLFNSCQPILRLYTGSHKPKYETLNSISSWLDKNKIEYDKNKITYFSEKNKLMAGYEKIDKVPSYMIFDKNGILINNPSACFSNVNINHNQFIPIKNDLIQFNSVKDTTLYSFFKKNMSPFIDKNFKINKNNADFIVLFFWAKYLGKNMNLKITEEIQRFKDSSVTYDYYIVNLDFVR